MNSRTGRARLRAMAAVFALAAIVGCTAAPPVAQTFSPTAASTPSASGQATPQPATPLPASPAPTSPRATPAAVEPVRIATGELDIGGLVVDANGVAHAVATDADYALVGNVYYLTNAGGAWTIEQLTQGRETPEAIASSWEPSITLDTDGTLWVSFRYAEGSPEDPFFTQAADLYVTTRPAGVSASWSEAVPIGGGDAPDLLVNGGRLHMVSQDAFVGDVRCAGEGGEPFELTYRSTADGEFTEEVVAEEGLSAVLALASDGTPRILYSGDYECATEAPEAALHALEYATAATERGSFTVEPVPGTEPVDRSVGLGLDSEDRAHAVFVRDEEYEGSGEVYYVRREAEGWTQPELVVDRARPSSVVLDPDGTVYFVARRDDRLLLVSNAGGSFSSTPPEPLSDPAEELLTASLALDATGRVHALVQSRHAETGEQALWYVPGWP